MVYRYNLTLWDIIGIILYIITLYPSPRETIYPGYLLSRHGKCSTNLEYSKKRTDRYNNEVTVSVVISWIGFKMVYYEFV